MLVRATRLENTSTYVLEIGIYSILLGCGMDVARGIPIDFGPIVSAFKLDCVLLTDSRITTCGALPHLYHVHSYRGPVLMSYFDKYMSKALVSEYIENRVGIDKKQFTTDVDPFYSPQSPSELLESLRVVEESFSIVSSVSLGRSSQVANGLHITAVPSGHADGGVGFHIQTSSGARVVYMNDSDLNGPHSNVYLTSPNLATLQPSDCSPDVLLVTASCSLDVSETRTVFERDLLRRVYNCVNDGGQVLIPIYHSTFFHYLLALVVDYCKRLRLTIPIYCTTLAELPQVFASVKQNHDASRVKAFDEAILNEPTVSPFIVFSCPGIISEKKNAKLFKYVTTKPGNLLVLSEYCIEKTLNYDILYGTSRNRLSRLLEKEQLKCNVHQVPCGDQTDARSIAVLAKNLRPKHLMVTGTEDKGRMELIQQLVQEKIGIPCHFLLHFGGTVSAYLNLPIPISMSFDMIAQMNEMKTSDEISEIHGVLLCAPDRPLLLLTGNQCKQLVDLPQHEIFIELTGQNQRKKRRTSGALSFVLSGGGASAPVQDPNDETTDVPIEPAVITETFERLVSELKRWLTTETIHVQDGKIRVRTVQLSITDDLNLWTSYSTRDQELATRLLGICNRVLAEKQNSLEPEEAAPSSSGKRAIW